MYLFNFVVLLALGSIFPAKVQTATCVIDDSATTDIWLTTSWECDPNSTLVPSFNDTAIIRNVTITIDSAEAVDTLFVTDAGGLVIDGGSLSTRIIFATEYSDITVDDGSNLDVSSDINNAATYIALDCSSFTINDGAFAITGAGWGNAYVRMLESVFTKAGTGEVSISTGTVEAGEVRNHLRVAAVFASDGSVFSVSDDLTIIGGDTLGYNPLYFGGEILDAAAVLLRGSELWAGNLFVYGGDSYDSKGAAGAVSMLDSKLELEHYLSIIGGNGGIYLSPLGGESVFGGPAGFFCESGSVYVPSDLTASGGVGGRNSDEYEQDSSGGEAVVRVENCEFSVYQSVLVSGGQGGGYDKLAYYPTAGRGGNAVVHFYNSELSLNYVYFTGGDGGDNIYSDNVYSPSFYRNIGGEAQLIIRSPRTISRTFTTLDNIDFIGKGGNSGLNPPYYRYSDGGGDCSIKIRGPDYHVFTSGSLSCQGGDGGDAYYSGGTGSILNAGDGGEAKIVIEGDLVYFTDEFSISIIGGNGGYFNYYSQNVASSPPPQSGNGGEAALVLANVGGYFDTEVTVELLGGRGGDGGGGDGGEATLLIYKSQVSFYNSMSLIAGDSGLSLRQDPFYGGTAGSAQVYMYASYPVVFAQNLYVIGGDGENYLSDGTVGGDGGVGGESVLIVKNTGVWFENVDLLGGDGGDAYNYYTGKGGYVYASFINSKAYVGDLNLIAGDAGTQRGYSVPSTLYVGGEAVLHVSSSLLNAYSVYLVSGSGSSEDNDNGVDDSDYYAIAGSSGYVQVLVYSSEVVVETTFEAVSGNGGDGFYRGGDVDSINVYLQHSSFLTGSLSLTGGRGGDATRYYGGYGGEVVVLNYNSTMVVSGDMVIDGGDGGSSVYNELGGPYPAAGEGGEALWKAFRSISSVLGDTSLSAGDGGDSYNFARAGDGGNVFVYFSSCDSYLEYYLFGGSISVFGGDGGDAFYPFTSDADDPTLRGGNGGAARLLFKYLYGPYQNFGSYIGVWGGDAGDTTIENYARPSWIHFYYSSFWVDGDVSIIGGDGGNLPDGTTFLSNGTLSLGAGGLASFYASSSADDNYIRGDLTVSGGDSGGAEFDDFATLGSYSGRASIRIHNTPNTVVYGSIYATSGSLGDVAAADFASGVTVDVESSHVVVEGSVVMQGGTMGYTYYFGGEAGLIYLLMGSSRVVVGGDLTLSGSSGLDSVIEAGFTGFSRVYMSCSQLRVEGEMMVEDGEAGDCTTTVSDGSGGGFGGSNSAELSTYESTVIVGGDIFLTAHDSGDSCNDAEAKNPSNAILNCIHSHLSAYSVTLTSGNGGTDAPNSYISTLHVEHSVISLKDSLTLVDPVAGDSTSSSRPGGDVSSSVSYPQVFISHGSEVAITNDFTISGGSTGDAFNNNSMSSGVFYEATAVVVVDQSDLWVGGDMYVSSVDLGDATAPYGVSDSNGGEAVVWISSWSTLTVEGEMSIIGGEGSTNGNYSDGGNAGVLGSGAHVWLRGDTYITAGDAGDNGYGHGGDAYFYFLNSIVTVDAVTVTPGGGNPDGHVYLINDKNSELRIGGPVTLQGDSTVLQRHSELTVFPCEDADLTQTGTNLHLWFSVFEDCRGESTTTNYEEPTGDESSEFDCAPCTCDDLDDDVLNDVCENPSPTPSPLPDPPSSDSIPSSASSFSSFLLSFFY